MHGRFTEGARNALNLSQEAAKEFGHNYVGTEHVLLGIVAEGKNAAARLLSSQGIGVNNVANMVEKLIGKGENKYSGNIGYTPRTKRVIEASLTEAKNLGNNYVGAEHLLLALISERESVAVRVLADLGVDMMALGEIIKKEAGAKNRAAANSSTPTLDQYGKDITKAAREGELDPVIGRQQEIERIVQILSRRTKNNPVLIGEPGVGKSAIAEGLAQKIVEGNIPELLKGKRVVSLDMSSILAGAKYRGEFEERMKTAINELKADKSVILFIDELHTLVGAGAAEGAIDAANILKPALARGEIQVVGATTLDEYRKYIEKDAALERRFQPVTVGEPTTDEAKEILRGLRDKYEAHHKVRISDEAIEAAVMLADRYISDRFLPDKAIDLMDEAASKVRISSFTAPPDLKELENKLERLQKEKEEAVNHQNFEKAAGIRDEEQKSLKEIESIKEEWKNSNKERELTVGEEEIAQIVSSWTRVPVVKLTEDESQRLLNLEGELRKRVIGQQEALSAVSRAIRRARAGLKDPKRPIGSFIFLGPTGVGKTELSKALAQSMFGDEDAMIRLDMSEYMEMHTVAKLIGSPPGYVGYDDGGQLTEKVRRKPYSVVLFDEIEKAHPDVFNILLQIMEDGRLTDGKGRVVNFQNTVIIMTSNVGASSFQRQRSMGFGAQTDGALPYERFKQNMLDELKKTFRPEFVNRVDEIIVFHTLDKEDTRQIVDLMLADVAKRLKDQGIELIVGDEAKDFLASEGFDEMYGARPLRRAIQQKVEDSLSEELLAGRIALGDSVEAYMSEGKLAFRKAEKAEV
ncbi:MAG: ATP-dependent Clp protease ATP-binding subunit [Christensenellales bacterium]